MILNIESAIRIAIPILYLCYEYVNRWYIISIAGCNYLFV